MAEPGPDNAPEGWRVPQRIALITAVLVPLAMLAIVVAAGWVYNHRLHPPRRQPVTTFPAPGVETFIHDGAADPERPVTPPPVDPAIDAAKRRVAADGLADWQVRP